jgi:hypothetical protein
MTLNDVDRHKRTGLVHRLGILMTALTMALVAAVTTGSGPAAAHTATYHWENNHTICNGCAVARGNIVKMWQGILLSALDGLGSCSTFADGSFGPKTAAATKTWQSQRFLTADGIVGPKTWSKAYSLLAFHASQAGYDFYRYHGGNFNMWFRRSWSTGAWEFQFGFSSGCDSVTWFSANH